MSVSPLRLALLVLVLTAAPEAAQAQEPAPLQAPAEPQRMVLPKPVAQMRATYLSRLSALQAAFAATKDPAHAMELQNEIRLAKLGFEADFLHYQLERVQRYGRVEAQKELTAALAAIRALMRGDAPAPAPVAPAAPAETDQ